MPQQKSWTRVDTTDINHRWVQRKLKNNLLHFVNNIWHKKTADTNRYNEKSPTIGSNIWCKKIYTNIGSYIHCPKVQPEIIIFGTQRPICTVDEIAGDRMSTQTLKYSMWEMAGRSMSCTKLVRTYNPQHIFYLLAHNSQLIHVMQQTDRCTVPSSQCTIDFPTLIGASRMMTATAWRLTMMMTKMTTTITLPLPTASDDGSSSSNM